MLSAAFWIVLWEVVALAVGKEILLVSPVRVVIRLFHLVRESSYWQAILFSMVRITLGFTLSLTVGSFLAILSYRHTVIEHLCSPLLRTIKATPVASFIILVLLWIPSRNLSVFISFLMGFPIIYANLLEGLKATDKDLIEMAVLFRISKRKRITAIYLSQTMPYLHSACALALGLCWKSGIAAEVIGMPEGSMGEQLYQAKIFLASEDLFAWTLTIILCSVVLEHLVLRLIDLVAQKMECAV